MGITQKQFLGGETAFYYEEREMEEILRKVNGFIWGVPALVLILGVGIYLTLKTGCVQIRLLPQAIRNFISTFSRKKATGDGFTPFRALCTALAATVGTGNLAGVAGAIAIGGPGSVFWMWISAFLGMVTKFAEAVLAVVYRTKNENGEYIGGPMYMIRNGMGERWRWLAVVYAFFGVVAAFGVGNATQINAVISGVNSTITAFGGEVSKKGNLLMGAALAVLIGLILVGGAKRIGTIAEILVPFASVAYILLCIGILIARYPMIPGAFSAILRGAFSPQAVTGGAIGSAMQALKVGTSRGVFTNEAGMGTASIAHSAANVSHPVEQGLMGIVEVFLDTIVICTMTALVILCSGVDVVYGVDTGAELTTQAFASVYGNWVNVFLAVALACFAIATVLGWGLYGIRCAQYLFGEKAWKPFAWMQIATVLLGAILNTGTVWLLAEIVNGLMAIPNLIALVFLSPELIRQLQDYSKQRRILKTEKC